MPPEPVIKRAVAFVDGQNLYFAARDAFGYRYPNYDVAALSRTICERQGWRLTGVYFYTGLPTESKDPLWHRFWLHKLAAMGRKGVRVCTRPLRYRTLTIDLPGGTKQLVERREEKGIDVRLALDIVRLAHREALDPACEHTLPIGVGPRSQFHATLQATGRMRRNSAPRGPPEPGTNLSSMAILDIARAQCREQGWQLSQVRFPTDIPEPADAPFWSRFWPDDRDSQNRAAVTRKSIKRKTGS